MNEIDNQEMLLTVGGTSNQYLTFTLNDQDFGIEILRVQEIKNYTRVTPIPNTSACIKGMMNLRGTVVPIVDLRIKFNMPATEYSQFTVIIVVNIGTKIMGLIVDAVSDVLNIEPDAIEETPSFGGIDTSFITGLAKSGERLVTLLNIEQFLFEQNQLAPTN
ncbi:MAG: chemotaxis protein CheW [Pirellulaceae bacterium]|nr:chemotaxis protein CheW [Pirellulaceae bacterium]